MVSRSAGTGTLSSALSVKKKEEGKCGVRSMGMTKELVDVGAADAAPTAVVTMKSYRDWVVTSS